MTSPLIDNLYDFRDRYRTEAFGKSRFVQVKEIVPVLTSSPQPVWLETFLSEVCNLAKLGENWDDRHSAPVRHDVLYFASSVLSRVMSPTIPAPSMVPLANGGVQMVWLSPRAEIEAEIARPNEAIMFHKDRSTMREEEWPSREDFSRLAEVLKAAYL